MRNLDIGQMCPRPAPGGHAHPAATAAADAPLNPPTAACWEALPRDLGREFRGSADRLARAMLAEIQTAVPAYAQPLDGKFGQNITLGIRQAIVHCIDRVITRRAGNDSWKTVFRDLGRIEFEEGRSLDCLQAAYRVGGRVALRHVSEFGRARGADSQTLCLCAEAIFAYVDEISALSVAGYTAAAPQAGKSLSLRRRELVHALISEVPVSSRSIKTLAEAAHWVLPAELTVIVFDRTTSAGSSRPPEPPPSVLAVFDGPAPCAIAPDIPSREGFLAQLGQWRAAVGPAVPVSRSRVSFERAQGTLDLGAVWSRRPAWCARTTTSCRSGWPRASRSPRSSAGRRWPRWRD